jgi:hypothetical protein
MGSRLIVVFTTFSLAFHHKSLLQLLQAQGDKVVYLCLGSKVSEDFYLWIFIQLFHV